MPSWRDYVAVGEGRGPRSEGQTQDQIADELRPAIAAIPDELDRWLAR
jgi:hypothetical protein